MQSVVLASGRRLFCVRYFSLVFIPFERKKKRKYDKLKESLMNDLKKKSHSKKNMGGVMGDVLCGEYKILKM